MNSLQKVFDSSPEADAWWGAYARKLYEDHKNRKPPNLVESDRDKNGNILLMAEPFAGFFKDCTMCKHYFDPHRGMITGGECMIHDFFCGRGFTCKDFADSGIIERMER